jgi:hypothetical protein
MAGGGAARREGLGIGGDIDAGGRRGHEAENPSRTVEKSRQRQRSASPGRGQGLHALGCWAGEAVSSRRGSTWRERFTLRGKDRFEAPHTDLWRGEARRGAALNADEAAGTLALLP